MFVVLFVGAFIGSALSQWWDAPSIVSEPVPVPRPTVRVRVEVLNGGGRTGVAAAATESLRDAGFDVVYYGNAASFDREASVVLDRVGKVDLARPVADLLGIRQVLSEPDSNLFLDVTVVLGEDWPSPTAVEPDPVWWDLRRLLKRGEEPSNAPLADPGVPD